MMEIYLVVPTAATMSYSSLCKSTGTCKGGDFWSNLSPDKYDNICTACFLTVIAAWSLMIVTAFIDTPLLFNLMVSFFGYYKGQSRKLQNVFARSSCVVDLTTSGRARRDLTTLFGGGEWKHGLPIWKSMIEALYKRDLISYEDKDLLEQSGKKFDFSLINKEARERLSFFLKTIHPISKATYRQRIEAKKLRKDNIQVEKKLKYRYSALQYHDKKDYEDSLESKGRDGRDEKKTPFLSVENKGADEFVFNHRSWTPSVHLDARYEEKVEGMGRGQRDHDATTPDSSVVQYLSCDEEMDWFLRAIPRLSHVITCYNETVILSKGYLQAMNGQLTNLEHLINLSTYRQEWHHFCARYKRNNRPEGKDVKILERFLSFSDEDYKQSESYKLIVEVRLWASYRAQTVVRTIRGALAYFQSLVERFDVLRDKNFCLHDVVELIVAHQTYGQYPRKTHKKKAIDGWCQRREDMEWILKRNNAYPILLVYDWCHPPEWQQIKEDQEREMGDFNEYWKEKCEKYWKIDFDEIGEYWRCRKKKMEECSGEQKTAIKDFKIPKFKHATCIKAMVAVDVDGKQKEQLSLIAVLPRMNTLRIGHGTNATQGKAANHINALRAVSGHIIQVSDANMDSWIGEGYKVPWITRRFMDGKPSERGVGNRINPLCRIIGFREYIFTGPMGMVGEAMASAEFVFGTLFQRVLTDPLDVRMHYGHPDFFDAFWVLSRGTLSKASPNINLSEDIFAGYNVSLRNQQISHSDNLEWQKGRETVFSASSGFLLKISAGSVAIQRSRDMAYMQYSKSLMKKMSLFYGGIGSFIFHVAINISISIYIIFFFLASYSGVTLTSIDQVGSNLGHESIISLGIIASFGYIIEMMLEYGWGAGLVQSLRIMPFSMIFYLHQNKCMASAVVESFRTGKAAYVTTGRPNAFDHYSLIVMYLSYASTHYYPAIEKMWLYYFYSQLTGSSGTLPMIMITLVLVSWIIAPVLFCPQISDLQVVKKDIFEAFSFLFAVVSDKHDKKEESESMDKFWRKREQRFHSEPLLTRIMCLLGRCIPCGLIWTIAYSAFYDYCGVYLFLWVGHILFTGAFFWTNYANIVGCIWMAFPILGCYFVTYATPRRTIDSVESLFGAFMLLATLRIAHHAFLILVTIFQKLCCCGSKNKCCNYEKLVKISFFVFAQFHVHLYTGVLIIAAQSVCEICLMIIQMMYTFFYRSWESAMNEGRSLKDSARYGGIGVKIE